MNMPGQDWMMKLDEMLRNLSGQWGTGRSTVLEETSALAVRLERVEAKLDQVLEELRAGERG